MHSDPSTASRPCRRGEGIAGRRIDNREGRAAYFKGVQPPASTLVGVTGLVDPDLLLEVEVVAALGSAARKPAAKKKSAGKRR